MEDKEIKKKRNWKNKKTNKGKKGGKRWRVFTRTAIGMGWESSIPFHGETMMPPHPTGFKNLLVKARTPRIFFFFFKEKGKG